MTHPERGATLSGMKAPEGTDMQKSTKGKCRLSPVAKTRTGRRAGGRPGDVIIMYTYYTPDMMLAKCSYPWGDCRIK